MCQVEAHDGACRVPLQIRDLTTAARSINHMARTMFHCSPGGSALASPIFPAPE
jgi:hypothetical protein